jgi:hypothetical protein
VNGSGSGRKRVLSTAFREYEPKLTLIISDDVWYTVNNLWYPYCGSRMKYKTGGKRSWLTTKKENRKNKTKLVIALIRGTKNA